MMMRRYLGRATGDHRKKKPFPLFLVMCLTTGGMALLLVAVLIMNPGSDIPTPEEKGSMAPSSVMPDSTDGGTSSG